MKTPAFVSVLLVATAMCGVRASHGGVDEIIWDQVGQPLATQQPSSDYVAPWEAWDVEVADDFDLVGIVTRVRAVGSVGGFLSPGAWVRFYDVAPGGGPGELLVEYFFDADDPNLLLNFFVIEAVLPEPLLVKGPTFVSIQHMLNGGSSNPTVAAEWNWNGTLNGFPNGAASHIRNPGGGWGEICTSWCPTDADRVFTLWGELFEPPPPPPPPIIASASPLAAPRSGRFIITGSHFTAATATHQVLLNGEPAPHAAWSDQEIHAYVPGDAPLGPATVQIVTAGGMSNLIDIDIQPAPPPQGRVKWRFLTDKSISHRAGIGSDGTVYLGDSGANVYAVAADGRLKWIYNMLVGGISGGSEGPVVVGPDDTIYVAGNPLGPDVNLYALNPDGTLRWVFTDTNTTGVIAGPNLGPDGNVYAVTNVGGLGAFALSPRGTLLWSNPGAPTLNESANIGAEIVFGPSTPGGAVDRFYLAFDQGVLEDRLYSFSLDGVQQFQSITGTIDDPSQLQSQPAIGPASGAGDIYVTDFGPGGSVGWRLKSFNSAGALNWTYFDIGTNILTAPETGPDGTIYVARNLVQLHAINPDGTQRWLRIDSNIHDTPTVAADNAMMLIGGAPDFGMPGFMQAAATQDGAVLWQVDLPHENGGYIVPSSRARFTADGATAYFGAVYLASDPKHEYSYLYAIDTADSAPHAGDVNGDGTVDINDLLAVIAAWGPCPLPPAACAADIAPHPQGDGQVNIDDLLLVISQWP